MAFGIKENNQKIEKESFIKLSGNFWAKEREQKLNIDNK
jgi:hypothetical protein